MKPAETVSTLGILGAGHAPVDPKMVRLERPRHPTPMPMVIADVRQNPLWVSP